MSETMLDKLAEFFEDKDKNMECHEYSAHTAAPYTRQEIRKEFKTYEAMLQAMRDRSETPVETVSEVKVEPKVKLEESLEIKTEAPKTKSKATVSKKK